MSLEAFAEKVRAANCPSGATLVVPLSREVVADGLTPVSAFAAAGGGPGSFLLESVVGGEKWGRYSFVGYDPAILVRGKGEVFELFSPDGVKSVDGVEPWEELKLLLMSFVPEPHAGEGLPRFWGGAVGYVAYDAVRNFEPAVGRHRTGPSDAYDFVFGIGATVLIFDNVRPTVRIVVPAFVDPEDKESIEFAYSHAQERLDAALELLRAAPAVPLLSVPSRGSKRDLPSGSMTREQFCEAVRRAQEHIRAGDIFQVVLSQRFTEPSADDFSLLDVYRTMRVLNPSPYMFFLQLPEEKIAGASPETLVRVEDGIATVRPIAGTRPRNSDDEEDKRVAEELLQDPKERAEHVMLVDLGRNDLGRISEPGSVAITQQMQIERYSHVMHIVSNVQGTLGEGKHALDAFAATFPAGTLSGAPKVRAMQIIDALEPTPRGIYGGAVGYVGFDGNLDMAIAIRTIVETHGEIRVQAGAGIVEASVPDSEYDETVNKARAALEAIAHVRRNGERARGERREGDT